MLKTDPEGNLWEPDEPTLIREEGETSNAMHTDDDIEQNQQL